MSDLNIESTVKNGFINWSKLEQFIKSELSLPDQEMVVTQFSEGYSNLTFLISIGEWEGVLRRPPYGEVPKKAHDMGREYQLLSKLYAEFNLAPRPLLYSEGEEIMDKHFYIMEKKDGLVIDDEISQDLLNIPHVEAAISQSLVDTLVKLQNVDYIQAGLENFGRPEGFLSRQVNGWITRYALSKTDEIPYISTLEKWLVDNLPTTQGTTIVHNDFKLNNMIFIADTTVRVNGVLDWELATIGDPLSDLGAAVAYWGQKDDPDLGIHFVTDKPGFYSRREIVETYANASKRNVDKIDYYLTFGFYKLAVILQQIFYRWKTGSLKDKRFEHLNKPIGNLIEMAHLAKDKRLL